MVPGSTLMYGSSLMLVTRMPRDSRIAAREAAAMPFPREETTPPVTKTYLDIYPRRVGMEEFTGTGGREQILAASAAPSSTLLVSPRGNAGKRRCRHLRSARLQPFRHAIGDPAADLGRRDAGSVHGDPRAAARAGRQHAMALERVFARRQSVGPAPGRRAESRPAGRVQ